MKYFLFLLLSLFIVKGFITISYAQNWDNADMLNQTDNELNQDEPTTVSFAINIPINSVDLVTNALCDNNGYQINAENAKEVVINYINAQVAYYKQRMAAQSISSQPIPIQ